MDELCAALQVPVRELVLLAAALLLYCFQLPALYCFQLPARELVLLATALLRCCCYCFTAALLLLLYCFTAALLLLLCCYCCFTAAFSCLRAQLLLFATALLLYCFTAAWLLYLRCVTKPLCSSHSFTSLLLLCWYTCARTGDGGREDAGEAEVGYLGF